MVTTPTNQTNVQPPSMSPMIAAALLAVAMTAGVWFIGRDVGRTDDSATAEIRLATATADASAGAIKEQAAPIASAWGASPTLPTVYIVSSVTAIDAVRMAITDTDRFRAGLGMGSLDAHVLVLPAGADAEAALAEVRLLRNVTGTPQFEVVDLRQTTIEAVTP